MRLQFEEIKGLVLAAAYETLYSVAEYESLNADDIHKLLSEYVSLGITRRALSSLADANLIKTDSFDETSPIYYVLTDAGLNSAEKLPSLLSQKRRLQQLAAVDDDRQILVPAADRIVSLSHNQLSESDKLVSELTIELEKDNGDPDQPGLRERLIGEIKAGRELIRAGEFRAYLLYETLFRALSELIKRYKNPTIVALAEALLGAIVSQIFQS